jgi:hypothetical protein
MIYRAYVRVPDETGAIFYEERTWTEDVRQYEIEERLPQDRFFEIHGKHDVRIQRGYKPLPISYGTVWAQTALLGRDMTERLVKMALETIAADCRKGGAEYAQTLYDTNALEGSVGILAIFWEEFGGCDELAESASGEYWWAFTEGEREMLCREAINGACSRWATFPASRGSQGSALLQ